MNSRDIPRSYAGLYGSGGVIPNAATANSGNAAGVVEGLALNDTSMDASGENTAIMISDSLLPFEIHRWYERSGSASSLTLTNVAYITVAYVTLIVLIQLLVLSLLGLGVTVSSSAPTGVNSKIVSVPESITITHFVHTVFNIIYLHWLKGSLYDTQGELNALTIWEQLEGTTGTRPLRRMLLVIPTVLCYGSCHIIDYHPRSLCIVNILFWCVTMLAKLPFMNGVRLFGINRTPGIDDDMMIMTTTTTTNVARVPPQYLELEDDNDSIGSQQQSLDDGLLDDVLNNPPVINRVDESAAMALFSSESPQVQPAPATTRVRGKLPFAMDGDTRDEPAIPPTPGWRNVLPLFGAERQQRARSESKDAASVKKEN
jgi:ORMDL family